MHSSKRLKALPIILTFFVGALIFPAFLSSPVKAQAEVDGTLFFDKPVDWSALWLLVKSHILWDLEWSSDGSVWISVKSDLTVQTNLVKQDTCKITLIFDASQAGSYRLTFAVDVRVRSYITKLDKYQYELEFEGFNLIFDWSDVISISGLQITHGMKEIDGQEYFWFRMRKDNVPRSAHVEIDPTVNFSTVSITSVHTCPLDQRTFVIAYSDDTNDDLSFQIYDTNGTQVVAETDVDDTAGGTFYTSVGLSAFNSTAFVVCWYDKISNYASFQIWSSTGSNLTNRVNIDTACGASYSVQVSCFNSSHFVIGWWDETVDDYETAVYNGATLVTGPTAVFAGVTSTAVSISVSCFNSTYYVVGFFDKENQDITFSVYDSTNTLKSGPTDVDSDVASAAYSVSVSALNSTYFVFGYYDNTVGFRTASYAVYTSSSVAIVTASNIDVDVGLSYSIQVSALNSTAFVISWYDRTDFDLTFAVLSTSNATLCAATDIESWPTAANDAFKYQSPCSQESATGIGIYNDNWIIVYANTTSQAIWQAFQPDGTVWDGTIPAVNTAPTNDACDSDATFTVNIYGWSNMTVSDVDLVANLQTVDIEVNTTGDAQTFTLRWTEATGAFSEVSDASGICTLGTSVRVNIDTDTDRICFNFSISTGGTAGACDVEATTTDDSSVSDVDLYSSEFTLAFYSSVNVVTTTHSFSVNPGDANITVTGGTISITVTANANFNVQLEGSGALSDGAGHTVALANIRVHKDTLASSISLTTDWQNIPGLTNQAAGSSLSITFVLWASCPNPQWAGTYTYTLTVQVVQA